MIGSGTNCHYKQLTFPPPSTFFVHSNAYKKLLGSFESQIKYGRTAVEMPAYPIVPMDRFVVGCTTGPNGGLCQLSPELDHPPHEEGTKNVIIAIIQSSLYCVFYLSMASSAVMY